VFWFDRHENLRLAPAATLELFGLIGEAAAARQGPKTALAVVLQCPRCRSRLRVTYDRQRNTPFRYIARWLNKRGS
jgi:hypothetical protein